MQNMGNLEKLGVLMICILVVVVGILAVSPKVPVGPIAATPAAQVDGADVKHPAPQLPETEQGGQPAQGDVWPQTAKSPQLLYGGAPKGAALSTSGKIIKITARPGSLVVRVTAPDGTYIIDCVEGGGGLHGDDYQSTDALTELLTEASEITFPRMLDQGSGQWRPVFMTNGDCNIGELDPDFILLTATAPK